MEKSDYTWPAVVGGAIILVLFVSLALVAGNSWQWFTDFLKGSASSWVQAIGSIAAIGTGFAVVSHQQRLEAERAAAGEAKLAAHRNDVVYFAIESLRQTSGYIARRIDDPASQVAMDAWRDMYLGGRRPLVDFPVLEIQRPALALAVMELVQFATLAERAFHPNIASARRPPLDNVENHCVDIQSKYWVRPILDTPIDAHSTIAAE